MAKADRYEVIPSRAASQFHQLPIVVRDIYSRLPVIAREGLSLVIVEQDIVQALAAANHVYCLQEGRVALEGAAAALSREAIYAAYFGI